MFPQNGNVEILLTGVTILPLKVGMLSGNNFKNFTPQNEDGNHFNNFIPQNEEGMQEKVELKVAASQMNCTGG